MADDKSQYRQYGDQERIWAYLAGRVEDVACNSPLAGEVARFGGFHLPWGTCSSTFVQRGYASYVNEICREMIPEVAKQKSAQYIDVFCDRAVSFPLEKMQTGWQNARHSAISAEWQILCKEKYVSIFFSLTLPQGLAHHLLMSGIGEHFEPI